MVRAGARTLGNPRSGRLAAKHPAHLPGPAHEPEVRNAPTTAGGSRGAALALLLIAAPTLACGGLIGPNGAVNLLRTTTFAGYHDGVEHYVTAFQFAGGGGAFGSITPLPGVPSSVEKGGDWTLQRLVRETNPQPRASLARGLGGVEASAEVIMQVRIDALDITVLKGGAAEVGQWASENGFRLPPDAPEVLEFYAKRSPIFLAAVFDADAAKAARPGDRRRDAGPHHHPDPEPVGPDPHPRPRQDRRRTRSTPTSTS